MMLRRNRCVWKQLNSLGVFFSFTKHSSSSQYLSLTPLCCNATEYEQVMHKLEFSLSSLYFPFMRVLYMQYFIRVVYLRTILLNSNNRNENIIHKDTMQSQACHENFDQRATELQRTTLQKASQLCISSKISITVKIDGMPISMNRVIIATISDQQSSENSYEIS